jgi:putative two-component system hydrogenase maturation factor HypX/HoxX
MRILFLTHAFNSLTQRLYSELTARGHLVSIEFDIADSVAEEAVALFRPDLIVAPYLRRAIPESVWRQHTCLIVHPGIVGDRGPSALDWAIQGGEQTWGVTVLQAEAEMDAGPVWAAETFPLRAAKKSSLYRNEVTQAATRAVLKAVAHFTAGGFVPKPLDDADPEVRGTLRPLMKQENRCIDWARDTTANILARIHAADGFPGVADTLFGEPCHLFDACEESDLAGLLSRSPLAVRTSRLLPGAVVARRESALLRITVDGAVWIGHAKRARAALPLKLPATQAFADRLADIPETALDGWWSIAGKTWQDIRYEECDSTGFLHFDFYNGAMSTRQCQRLQAAYQWALTRPTKVIVLMGGADYWSNGIHLNTIEAADDAQDSPADASWANINAIDDLAEAIICTDSHLTIAALQGNCGAGGCFLARAADLVWARDGVLLNPHYKNMGNLFGSEYWTYLLPPRVGAEGAQAIMQNRLPMTAAGGVARGFLDACLTSEPDAFRVDVARRAAELATGADLASRLQTKREKRQADEAARPLAQYRSEELAHMRRNFYGFDPSYHVARFHFVQKSPNSWTPRHLAIHRDLGWRVPE